MIPYNTVRSTPQRASGGNNQNPTQAQSKGKSKATHVDYTAHGTGHDHVYLEQWPRPSQASTAWDNLFVGALEEKDTFMSEASQRYPPSQTSSLVTRYDSDPVNEEQINIGISRATNRSATRGGLEEWPSQAESKAHAHQIGYRGKRVLPVSHSSSGSRIQGPIVSTASAFSPDLLNRPGFSPWTGHHAEDDLTSHAVQYGIAAKRLMKDDKEEIIGARHCVLPCLHKPTEVKSLPRFFSTVLQEQKACTKLSHVSVSKDPSRVTLTEQKREEWLTRFANPAIPLRKQSRSIPHGLHGRFLLEQCVSKNVPLARAVWLAAQSRVDCIRALLRRDEESTPAAGHEQKWLQDWTNIVTGLAEEMDCRDGKENQKQEATYVAQLSTRLYAEGLIDSEQYLDWVLTRLERCSLDHLSFIMVTIQSHQAELTSTKRHGQRLAAACTLRLHELSESKPESDVLQKLHARLDNFVQRLASSHVDHFAFPKIWRQVRYIFARKGSFTPEPAPADAIRRITSMNDRLCPWIVRGDAAARRPAQTVVQTLDYALPRLSLADLSSTLRALMPNLNELVACLIEWATSTYRVGGHMLYLACRLIRHWHEQQLLRSQHAITFALTKLCNSRTVSATSLARFCAEMGRSSHFNQTAYLQQLSTQPSVDLQATPFLSLLVAQISAKDVPTTFMGIQTPAMQSMNTGTDSKAEVVHLKQKIAAQLKLRTEQSDTDLQEHSILGHLHKITFKDRFELSGSLRSSLTSFLAKQKDGTDVSLPLHFVKAIVILLEHLDDYAVLLDVLMALISRCGLDGLELIALSAEVRDETFITLGSHTKLWQTLFSQYRALRSVNNSPHKDLCRFFLRTSYWYPNTPKLEQYLNREIEFCDNGFTACTPLSDMQIDTAEDGRSDLDRILANGPKLADQDLSTALNTILDHLCHVKEISRPQVDIIKSNLTALRSANEDSFASALAEWVRSQVATLEHQPLARALTLLLSSESMSIAALLECVESIINGGADRGSRTAEPKAALAILHFFFVEAQGAFGGDLSGEAEEDDNLYVLDVHNRWNRQAWRQNLLRSHGQSLIRLLGACLKVRAEVHRDTDLRSLYNSPSFIATVYRLFATSPALMYDELADVFLMDATMFRDNLRHFLAAIIPLPGTPPAPRCLSRDSDGQSVWTTDSKVLLVSQLFESINACSLPLFQTALRAATEDDGTSDSQLVLQSCAEHISVSAGRQCPLWPQLVSHIDVHIGKQLRIMSQKTLLFLGDDESDLVHAFQSAWTTTPSTHAAIINATRNSINAVDDPETTLVIAKHLQAAVQAIVNQLLPPTRDFVDWIRALILISLVHEQAFTTSADLTQLLCALCRIASLEKLLAHRDTVELAHDAACFFLPKATTKSLEQLKVALGTSMNASIIRELLDMPEETDPEHYPTTALVSFLTPRAIQNSSKLSV